MYPKTISSVCVYCCFFFPHFLGMILWILALLIHLEEGNKGKQGVLNVEKQIRSCWVLIIVYNS